MWVTQRKLSIWGAEHWEAEHWLLSWNRQTTSIFFFFLLLSSSFPPFLSSLGAIYPTVHHRRALWSLRAVFFFFFPIPPSIPSSPHVIFSPSAERAVLRWPLHWAAAAWQTALESARPACVTQCLTALDLYDFFAIIRPFMFPHFHFDLCVLKCPRNVETWGLILRKIDLTCKKIPQPACAKLSIYL